MAKNKAFEIAVILTAQDKMSRAISEGVNRSVKQLESLERSTFRFGRSSLRAGLAAGAALAFPAKSAADFEELMANVSTLVDTNIESISDMGTEIIKMGSRVPKPINEIADALYNVRSAGVAAGDAMSVTEQSGRLAVAGLSTVTESVDIMTSAYNAFKKEGLEANQIADIIFKTVKAGKTTVSELSSGFGANASILEDAGAKLADYQAATAALTTVGIPASQAQSGIRAAVVSLLKPTADLELIYQKLGVSGGKDLIEKSGNLGNAFSNVQNTADVLGIELVKVTGRVEAAATMANIAGATNKIYTDTLYSMVRGTNEVDKAFDKQMETFKNQSHLVRSELTGMAITIGRDLNPQILELLKEMRPVVASVTKWIQENPKLTGQIVKIVAGFAVVATTAGLVSLGLSQIFGMAKGLITMFGFLAKSTVFISSGLLQGAAVMMRTGSVIKGLTAATRALNLTMLANPFVLAVAAGVALGIMFDQLWKKSEVFRGAILGTWEVIKGFGGILKTYVLDTITGIVKGIGMMGSAISKLFKGDFSGAAKSALAGAKNITGIQAAQNAVQSTMGLGENYGYGYRLGRAQVQSNRQLSAKSTPVGPMQIEQAPIMPTGGSNEVTYAPNIQITGPVTQAQEQAFVEQLKKHKEEIVRIIQKSNADSMRVSF